MIISLCESSFERDGRPKSCFCGVTQRVVGTAEVTALSVGLRLVSITQLAYALRFFPSAGNHPRAVQKILLASIQTPIYTPVFFYEVAIFQKATS